MTTSNRAARIAKTFKVLKKHYKPVASPADRPLLEHLLYACCLENARFEEADETFAKLQQAYYDWNEVRVTTVSELAETMSALPDAAHAASRLKRCLQGVFETFYSFDLEFFKKQNIGKAVKELKKYDGVGPFAIAYVTQHSLGGHAIPTSQGALSALQVLNIVSEAEAKQHRVPGMERAVGKSKGIEFASLLQQFGADFYSAPYSTRVRAIFLEIDPDCKSRLPKRGGKRTQEESGGQSKNGAAGESPPRRKAAAGKSAQQPSKKKAPRSKKSVESKRQAAPAPESSGAAPPAKKSASKRISKRKPR